MQVVNEGECKIDFLVREAEDREAWTGWRI